MLEKRFWREILFQELPGEKAHLRMSPSFRGGSRQPDEPARAGVLVLLYPSGDDLCLIFIKRNEYDGPHSAQVSFPGGAWEASDGSLANTALRETREELGIADQIDILGELTPLHIPVSNFMVFPFLGWMERRPEFHPDSSEVQYVIEASLKELLDPANSQSEIIFHHNRQIEAPFYLAGKEKIWGATAMMLSEVLQLATGLQ
jgi:8-oxo-dGTP pyrophosphatase MutT (NUDIX family)